MELQRRVELFRAAHERVPLTGRVVVIVDDGVATGSTARAACLVAWAQGAARVVLAVPVAPQGWEQRFAGVADELVCVSAPRHLLAISCCYAHFPQVRDEEALACLTGSASPTHSSLAHSSPTQGPNSSRDSDCPDAAVDPRDGEVEVAAGAGAVALPGRLTVPVGGVRGVVVFAHGSGSSRHSPRNRQVAQLLNGAGLATLLFDLLTPAEGGSRANVFDVALLAERLAAATRWLRAEPGLAGLPVGWFGASTGAAAALWAAAEPDCQVAAVVSRGGRPDLAGSRLSLVRAPTLLIVGGSDDVVLRLNRQALARMRCQARMAVVPGATHLFEEPGPLEAAAQTARAWFLAHLTRTAPPARPGPALSGQPAAAGGSAGTGLAGGSAGTAAGGGSAGT